LAKESDGEGRDQLFYDFKVPLMFYLPGGRSSWGSLTFLKGVVCFKKNKDTVR